MSNLTERYFGKKNNSNAFTPTEDILTREEAISYAAQMGLSDSWRGIKQWYGKTWNDEELLEDLRVKDKKLHKIMMNPEYGTAATAAFFGGAILDPVGFIPVVGWGKKLKTAKNFGDFAKYGAGTGAVMSGISYTPEDYALFVDDDAPWAMKKLEQTAFGGTVGSLLSAGGAAGVNLYTKAKHGRTIFDSPDITIKSDSTPSKNLDKSGKEIIFRKGELVFLHDRKNQGEIVKVNKEKGTVEVLISNNKTGKSVRKEFGMDELRQLKTRTGEVKKAKTVLEDSWKVTKGRGREGRVWTLRDFENSTQAQDIIYRISKTREGYKVTKVLSESKPDKRYASGFGPAVETKEVINKGFGSVREAKSFVHKQINPKSRDIPKRPRPKLQQKLEAEADKIDDGMDSFNINKPLKSLWQDFTDNNITDLVWDKVILRNSAEWGGALAGTTGSLMWWADEEDSATEYFAKVAAGALLGGAGTKGLRVLDSKMNDGKLQEMIGYNFLPEFGLTQTYKTEKATYLTHKNTIADKFNQILKKSEKLNVEEERLMYLLMTGDTVDLAKISSDNLKLGKEARKLITEMSQEMVDTGLLNIKTFKRNVNTYMRRLYKTKEGQNTNAKSTGKQIKILADNLKARGKTHPNPLTKGSKKFKELKAQGYKIVETKPDGKVIMRRDWTKAERKAMGELENFSLSLAETGKLMSNDLAAQKFFKVLKTKHSISAEDFSKLSAQEQKNYRLMADTTIQGTKVKKYGALSGRYVDKYTFNDLTYTFRNIGAAEDLTGSKAFLRGYDDLLAIWKKTKTAWNLGTHVANTASNVILIDFAGTSHKYILRAAKEMKNNSKMWREAKIHGGMSADMVSNELRRTSNLFERKFHNFSPDAEGILGSLKNKFQYVWDSNNNYLRRGLDKAEDLYQMEDQIFRMAVYMDRIDKGFSKVDAAADARKWFIDYEIAAPGIQALKRSVLPFISYTYRVAPLLAEGTIRRPSALIKWGSIGYGLNALGMYMTDDEAGEKLDRLTMRENDKKTLWNLPVMPPAIIRLPWNSEAGDAQYLDVMRWLPGGDIFLQRESEGLGNTGFLSNLPAPIRPGGPVLDFSYMLMAGEDPFTGQEIEDDGMFPVLRHFLSHQLPNMPGIPGSYATERMQKTLKQNPPSTILGFDIEDTIFDLRSDVPFQHKHAVEPSPYSTPYGFWEAFAYGIGIKIKNIDHTKQAKVLEFETRQEISKIDVELRKLEKDFRHHSLSYEDYMKETMRLNEELISISAAWEKYQNEMYAQNLKYYKVDGDNFNKEMSEEIKKDRDRAWVDDWKDAQKRERERVKKRQPRFDGGIISEDHPVSDVTKRPSSRKNKYTKEPFLKESTEKQMNNLLKGINND